MFVIGYLRFTPTLSTSFMSTFMRTQDSTFLSQFNTHPHILLIDFHLTHSHNILTDFHLTQCNALAHNRANAPPHVHHTRHRAADFSHCNAMPLDQVEMTLSLYGRLVDVMIYIELHTLIQCI